MDTKIKENEKLVQQVINDLLFIPNSVEREELEQIGKIALWKGIESYDKDCGYKESTHCYKAINRDIVDYCRKAMAKKRQAITVKGGMTSDFSDELYGSLLVEEIHKFIATDDLKMFLDKTLGDMTFDQLSEKYGLTKMQVRHKHNKTKLLLQKNIKWEATHGHGEQK